MNKQLMHTIESLASLFEEASIPYTFIEDASLFLQGMDITPKEIKVLIQWDLFEKGYGLLEGAGRSAIVESAAAASFSCSYENMPVTVSCMYNTTIKTDPYRIETKGVWCRSLYSYMYSGAGDDGTAIVDYLLNKQKELTEKNEQAWNQNNYAALINRFGEPGEIANKIMKNPEWRLYPFGKYMHGLKGKKVLHLLGSNGVKAAAMALMGAEVSVVDFSMENATYAKEVAAAANVEIDYIVSDVSSLQPADLEGKFDYVLMELGVLHYFITLEPLFKLIKNALADNGSYILHEFHPISTKLITSSGKKHKVTGNYFNPELTYQSVAFSKHMPDQVKEELAETVQRKWTLGEIVTSAASAGLRITTLEEEPNHKMHDIGLPKTYTLVAAKQ